MSYYIDIQNFRLKNFYKQISKIKLFALVGKEI